MSVIRINNWALPFYLLTAYVVIVLLRPHEYTLSPITDIPILPVLMLASFVAWFLYGRRDFEAPQFYLAPLLLVVMCLSMIASDWAGGAVLIFRKDLPIIGLFVLIACTADTTPRLVLLLKIIVLAATVMAWHGITQVESGTGWSGATLLSGRITYVGIFNDPNDLGLLFVTSIPVLLYLYYDASFFVWRALLIASLASILYAIYLTNSRGTIVGLAATVGFYFWLRFGLLRTAILVSVLGPLAFVMAPSRFREMLAAGELDDSALFRFEAWYAGFNMFRLEPFLGVGVGRFGEHFFMTAHNSFVVVLAELGFLGAFVWNAFLGLSLYMMYRFQRAGVPDDIIENPGEVAEYLTQQKMARALMFSLLAFCSAGLFLSRAFDITLFIWCGLVVAHYQNCRRRWPNITEVIQLKGNIMKVFYFWLFTVMVSYLGMKVGLFLA
ncbi:MAG: O-antigen ligase family protein [Gammaproteobacteria bacterium]|jgi:O-antigen ligase|nr:O-antigen ligase family protein [Gammaproteobacteria bacterium]HJP03551.1 O-antigen ligase family protein [Gammaproteobacteria bacterium]